MPRTYREGDEPIPGYRLIDFLGSGGFGEVWKAAGPGGTHVAFKIVPLGKQQALKEFRALKLIRNVRHVNLVAVQAFWLKDAEGNVIDDRSEGADDPFASNAPVNVKATIVARPPRRQGMGRTGAELLIAMTLCDRNLLDRLGECERQGLPGIPADELLGYMLEASKALDFLNAPRHDLGRGPAPIQHCDIKPQNIMLLGGSALVGDFTLVREQTEDARTSVVGGSAAYISPEVCIHNRPSATTDQYSLAVSYYESRTGRLPFPEGSSAMMVARAVSEGRLDFTGLPPGELAVIRRATSLDPLNRYSTSTEMTRELIRAYERESGGVSPVDTGPASHSSAGLASALGVSGYSGSSGSKAAVVTPPSGVTISGVGPLAPGVELVPGYTLVRELFSDGTCRAWEARHTGDWRVALVLRELGGIAARVDRQALDLVRSLDDPRLGSMSAIWLLGKDGAIITDDISRLSDPEAGPERLVVAGKLAPKNALDRVLECRRGSQAGIPTEELFRILREVGSALDALHAPRLGADGQIVSLMHLDVRPVSILLHPGRTQLGNFSRARGLIGGSARIPANAIDFDAVHADPELLDGLLTRWSDQYALAVTYFEMRTGTLLSELGEVDPRASSARRRRDLIMARCPPAEANVLERAFSEEVGRRFESCEEMIEELASACGVPKKSTPSVTAPLSDPGRDTKATPGKGPSSSGASNVRPAAKDTIPHHGGSTGSSRPGGYQPGDEPVPGYRLEKFLGDGSFGRVWKAEGPGGVHVALKIVSLDRREAEEEIRSLKVVKNIRDVNLVPIQAFWLKDAEGRVFDRGAEPRIKTDDSDRPARSRGTMIASFVQEDESGEIEGPQPAELLIAMTLCDGNLEDRLKASKGKGMPIAELLACMEGAAKGLDFLNSPIHDRGEGPERIMHLDIKPANIMLLGRAAVVGDFTLARRLHSSEVRKTRKNLGGTLAYISPDVLLDKTIHPTTDQYSLAISYCELRTGKLPIPETATEAKIILMMETGQLDFSLLAPAERKVIRRATSRQPDKRYASCVEMTRALRKAVYGDESGRRKLLAKAIAVMLILLLGIGGYGYWAYGAREWPFEHLGEENDLDAKILALDDILKNKDVLGAITAYRILLENAPDKEDVSERARRINERVSERARQIEEIGLEQARGIGNAAFGDDLRRHLNAHEGWLEATNGLQSLDGLRTKLLDHHADLGIRRSAEFPGDAKNLKVFVEKFDPNHATLARLKEELNLSDARLKLTEAEKLLKQSPPEGEERAYVDAALKFCEDSRKSLRDHERTPLIESIELESISIAFEAGKRLGDIKVATEWLGSLDVKSFDSAPDSDRETYFSLQVLCAAKTPGESEPAALRSALDRVSRLEFQWPDSHGQGTDRNARQARAACGVLLDAAWNDSGDPLEKTAFTKALRDHGFKAWGSPRELEATVDALEATNHLRSTPGSEADFAAARDRLSKSLAQASQNRRDELCERLLKFAEMEDARGAGLADLFAATRAARDPAEPIDVGLCRREARLRAQREPPDFVGLAKLAAETANESQAASDPFLLATGAEALAMEAKAPSGETIRETREKLLAVAESGTEISAEDAGYARYVAAALERESESPSVLAEAARQLSLAYSSNETPPLLARPSRVRLAVDLLDRAADGLYDDQVLLDNPFGTAENAQQARDWLALSDRLASESMSPASKRRTALLACGAWYAPNPDRAEVQKIVARAISAGDNSDSSWLSSNLRLNLQLVTAASGDESPSAASDRIHRFAELHRLLSDAKEKKPKFKLEPTVWMAKVVEPGIATVESAVDELEKTASAKLKAEVASLYGAQGQLIQENLYEERWSFLSKDASPDARLRAKLARRHSAYVSALRWNDDRAEYYVGRGQATFDLNGDIEEVRKDAETAERKNPDSATAYKLHAEALLRASFRIPTERMTLLTLAREHASNAVRLARSNRDTLARALIVASAVELQIGNFAPERANEGAKALNRAVDFARQATELDPEWPYLENAHEALGNALEDIAWQTRTDSKQNYEAAVIAFDNAIATRDLPKFHFDRGRCLCRQAEYGEKDLKLLNAAMAEFDSILSKANLGNSDSSLDEVYSWRAHARALRLDVEQSNSESEIASVDEEFAKAVTLARDRDNPEWRDFLWDWTKSFDGKWTKSLERPPASYDRIKTWCETHPTDDASIAAFKGRFLEASGGSAGAKDAEAVLEYTAGLAIATATARDKAYLFLRRGRLKYASKSTSITNLSEASDDLHEAAQLAKESGLPEMRCQALYEGISASIRSKRVGESLAPLLDEFESAIELVAKVEPAWHFQLVNGWEHRHGGAEGVKKAKLGESALEHLRKARDSLPPGDKDRRVIERNLQKY